MNVLLLNHEEYLNYLSVDIPKWKSEGEKELSDKQSVWDWIKARKREYLERYFAFFPKNFHRDEPFHLNSPWNCRQFYLNGKRSKLPLSRVFYVLWPLF